MPFDEYLQAAIERNRKVYENETAWRTPLWEFVRLMKAHPDLRWSSEASALKRVEYRMVELGRNWTRDFSVVSPEDARIEFLDTWPRVRFLPGYGIVDYALDWAQPEIVETDRTRRCPPLYKGYSQFLCFLIVLQEAVGEKPILLPVHKLAPRLKVSAMSISRWIRWACQDRVLKRVAGPRYNPEGRGLAAKYRVELSDWPNVVQWLGDGRRNAQDIEDEVA
jgi:hypothetical protein